MKKCVIFLEFHSSYKYKDYHKQFLRIVTAMICFHFASKMFGANTLIVMTIIKYQLFYEIRCLLIIERVTVLLGINDYKVKIVIISLIIISIYVCRVPKSFL